MKQEERTDVLVIYGLIHAAMTRITLLKEFNAPMRGEIADAIADAFCSLADAAEYLDEATDGAIPQESKTARDIAALRWNMSHHATPTNPTRTR